jgi:Putative amidoligase enzyme
MESVSPKLKSSNCWEIDIRNFWNAMREMFEVQKSPTCGTHVHLAPWERKYTLQEAKTIAFACCYYERYVISCLPKERRDYDYCRLNSMVATKMGKLYQAKTSNGLAQIASDINALDDFDGLIGYMQGGLELERRKVLWNFRNLRDQSKGTIEFRGGRHLRGPRRAIAWITFAQVFILMALDEVRSSAFRKL